MTTVLRYLMVLLPEELRKALKVEAAKRGITQNKLVIKLLEEGLKK